ncbi:MAG: hypothetical protein ACON48_01330 [Chitinophagales bacterium]
MDRKKNIFDKIGSLIPGYMGYSEREGRRNCDKILREEIVLQLNDVEKILYSEMKQAIDQENTSQLKMIEEVRKQINTFSSRVQFSPHGATSFFSDSEIKEDELLMIYQIDLDLAESVKNLSKSASMLHFNDIERMLSASQEILKKRNSYIANLK